MDLTPIILFRKNIDTEEEMAEARKHFPCVELRSKVPSDSLVIARYSALPFYKELEDDLATNKSLLINSYAQHRWIANFAWYYCLKHLTPKSWFEQSFYKAPDDIAYVVKGVTNSRKHQWNTHMFAKNKRDALEVAGRLANDSLIGPQGLVYREYVPLKTLEISPLYGLPYTNEWRMFYYKKRLLSFGYYWSTAIEQQAAQTSEKMFSVANEAAAIVSEHANFFVLDLAETVDSNWIVIEVNDGQMSGLSEVSAEALYMALKQEL